MREFKSFVRWKNEDLLKKARDQFPSFLGERADERFQRIVREFLDSAEIFQFEPTQEVGTVPAYVVTVDLKQIKWVSDARGERPLTLLKLNGVALMYCRFEGTGDEGILFKVCPQDMMIHDRKKFDKAVSAYNRDYNILTRHHQQEAERTAA